METKNFYFAIPIIVTILLWGFFLHSSGLQLSQAIKVSGFQQTLSNIISISFILFLAIFPTTIAIIVALAKILEKKEAIIISLLGSAIGLGISIALFSNLKEFLIIIPFYLIGVFLAIQTISINFLELKKFVLPRAMMNAAGKIGLLTAVGIFAATAMIGFSSQKEIAKDFENTIMSKVGNIGGAGGITDLSADLMINTQQQLLRQFSQMPQFKALKNRTDVPEAQEYVLTMEALQKNLESEEFKKQVKQQIAEQIGEKKVSSESIFEIVKQKFPIYSKIMEWLWLIEAVTVFSLILTISSVIWKPLSALFGIILGLFIKEKTTSKTDPKK